MLIGDILVYNTLLVMAIPVRTFLEDTPSREHEKRDIISALKDLVSIILPDSQRVAAPVVQQNASVTRTTTNDSATRTGDSILSPNTKALHGSIRPVTDIVTVPLLSYYGPVIDSGMTRIVPLVTTSLGSTSSLSGNSILDSANSISPNLMPTIAYYPASSVVPSSGLPATASQTDSLGNTKQSNGQAVPIGSPNNVLQSPVVVNTQDSISSSAQDLTSSQSTTTQKGLSDPLNDPDTNGPPPVIVASQQASQEVVQSPNSSPASTTQNTANKSQSDTNTDSPAAASRPLLPAGQPNSGVAIVPVKSGDVTGVAIIPLGSSANSTSSQSGSVVPNSGTSEISPNSMIEVPAQMTSATANTTASTEEAAQLPVSGDPNRWTNGQEITNNKTPAGSGHLAPGEATSLNATAVNPVATNASAIAVGVSAAIDSLRHASASLSRGSIGALSTPASESTSSSTLLSSLVKPALAVLEAGQKATQA